MLGVAEGDNEQDQLLQLIMDNTNLQLIFKLGLDADIDKVPKSLSYIPIEVAVKRYNRLKNEGMTSYTQEGESITFNANDFDEFQNDIADWKKQHGGSVLRTIDPYRRGR